MNKEALLKRFSGKENSNVVDFLRSDRKKILYGQGWQALICYHMCRRQGSSVVAFIGGGGGRDNERHSKLPRDIPFYNSKDFPFEKSDYDVLLALNEEHNAKVLELLKSQGWNYLYFSDKWRRTNEEYYNSFFETFLEEHDIDPEAVILQKGNFQIFGTNHQPETYNYMLRATFFDIITPSLFAYEDELYSGEGGAENGPVQVVKSDVVFDLGANVGTFSCLAASKGGRVYAFEPTPSTVLFLKKNASLYQNIKIEEYAVSDKDGECFFYVNDMRGEEMSSGWNRMFFVERMKERLGLHVQQIKVKTITLDSFVKDRGLDRVDFIKADIEGAERYMLAGAKEVLRKFAPKLSLCTYHRPDDKEVMTKLIMEANPAYKITYGPMKLYAWVEK